MSSRAWQAVGSLLSISLVLALAATARSDGPSTRLKGPALAGPTHLHLIVSGAPPFIFDVDANAVREVTGVADSADATVSVARSGKDALAVVHGTQSAAVRIHLGRLDTAGSAERGTSFRRTIRPRSGCSAVRPGIAG